jgi:L-threonylcarbamoyladenylate synthase
MQTQIGTDLTLAASLLRHGDLVAIPTETVYGLAGNGLNPIAVAKIFDAKQRPFFNPLILHVSDWDKVPAYVATIPEEATKLARELCPGPITFLLPKNEQVPDIVTAGSPLVAIRVPAHPMTRQLLEQLDFPLAAPSANPFGYVSPTTAQHVWNNLGGKIPYILDGGPASVGVESTIIGFRDNTILLYRLGGISTEILSEISGLPVVDVRKEDNSRPSGPGMLQSHYATHAPLYIGAIEALASGNKGKKCAAILFSKVVPAQEHLTQFVLSPEGDLQEAAAKLFAVMRFIDEAGFEVIFAEPFPDTGLGRAINDRLNRAQAIFK